MRTKKDKHSSWRSEYRQIPGWAIGSEQDLASVIAAVCLAGFEGQWLRVDARTQIAMMGKAYFGKRHFRVSPSKIEVARKVCFGMDYDLTELDRENWNRMVKQGYLP